MGCGLLCFSITSEKIKNENGNGETIKVTACHVVGTTIQPFVHFPMKLVFSSICKYVFRKSTKSTPITMIILVMGKGN